MCDWESGEILILIGDDIEVMCGFELVWVSSFGWRRQRSRVRLALRNLVKLKFERHPDTTCLSYAFQKVPLVVCDWHLT